MTPIEEQLVKYEKEVERKESIEHRDTLLAIAAILKTEQGQKLFRYLFKHLEVANLPERGLDNNTLQEYLGFLRAGNSIYKLACEAASEESSRILAKIERERYEHLYEQHRIQNGLYRNKDDE
jgi:hypothetical protein